jgi:hypothetical protein
MEDDGESPGTGDDAPESLLPYDRWTEEALRGVVVRALANTAAHGLPGAHHFYITFRTDAPGVTIPPRLKQKYPHEMTIVLQHQFDNLTVDEAAGVFGVSLSFGGVLSPLTIPLSAVTAFVDPHVQYGLRFQASLPAANTPDPAPEPPPPAPQPHADQPQVVSLDAFRRKRD